MNITYCTRCGRTGDDLDACPNKGTIMPCPTPTDTETASAVVLRCGPCDKTLAVPVGEVMKGKTSVTRFTGCPRQDCCAKVLAPQEAVSVEIPVAVPFEVTVQNPILEAAMDKLTALEAAGVENWEGYTLAMTMLGETE